MPRLRACFLISAGISQLSLEKQAGIFQAVKHFDAFTPDNDPHGGHDCAVLTVGDRKVIWKIDYYDTKFEGHSPDPADDTITKRVLTVMLAEEY